MRLRGENFGLVVLLCFSLGVGVALAGLGGGAREGGGSAGTVTSPATGAGTDTCTGAGCAIGAAGISTDGGIVLGAPSVANKIYSYTTAATATSTVPAVEIRTDAALASTDTEFCTATIADLCKFTVAYNGDTRTFGDFYAGPSATFSVGISTGVVTSSPASGVNAFAVGTNGARMDFGTGASDYASSDGTTVSFAGPLATTQLDMSGSALGVNAIKLANGVGLNFSLADNYAYLSRSASDTLRVGDGTNSTLITGALTTNRVTIGLNLAFSATAPTSPVACTSPTITHGTTTSFQAGVGTSCTGVSTFAFTVPATANGTRCTGDNITAPTTRYLAQTAGWTGTTVTMTNYSRTLGTAADFADSANVVINCTGR